MKSPDDQAEALFTLADELETAGIPYMITWSIALSFYAEPRNTNDIDVVIEADESDLDTILALFPDEYDWYVSRVAAEEAAARRSMFNAIHPATGLKVDLVFLKNTELEQLKFSRRQRVSQGDKSLWLIRPEDLLLSKLAWGQRGDSAMQAEDVRKLIRDAKEMDWEYVNEWLDRTGLRKAYDDVRSA